MPNADLLEKLQHTATEFHLYIFTNFIFLHQALEKNPIFEKNCAFNRRILKQINEYFLDSVQNITDTKS